MDVRHLLLPPTARNCSRDVNEAS